MLIIALGVVVVLVGVLVALGAFGWFGRLPGDIRWEGQRARVFIPVTTMIVLSVVLTVVLNLILRR
jgi:uncharacterized membrane protein YidH (DUF202 family)